jgi:mono/diheme cytochrome c family protein
MRSPTPLLFPLLLLLSLLLSWGLAFAEEKKEAGESRPDTAAIERGKKLFADTQDFDYASCADCHNVVPEDKEAKEAKFLGPGGTLFGSARRAGWRNRDTFKDVVDASEYCAKTWQKRKKGFDAKQEADLGAYLRSIGGKKPLPKRKVERKPKLLDEIGGGDAEKGKKTAIRYCGRCHNPDGLSFDLEPNSKKRDLIARKVRGYDAKRKFRPQKGTMSYYTTDRLTDEQLRDIIAFLGK